MRIAYRVLAYLIAAVVALQAGSVALAFFTMLHEMDGGAVIGAGYDFEGNTGILAHRVGGLGIIPLAAIALLVVSFFTRALGAVRRAAIVFGLVVLQIGLVFAAFVVAWTGALHGANAIVLLLAALWAAIRVGTTSPRAVAPATGEHGGHDPVPQRRRTLADGPPPSARGQRPGDGRSAQR